MGAATTDSEARAAVVGECPVRLWGLTGQERLRRQLASLGVRIIDDPATSGANPLLLLRADFLFDARTLGELIDRPDLLVEAADEDGRTLVVAAHVGHATATHAAAIREALAAGSRAPRIDGASVQAATELRASYMAALLKADRPLLLPIRSARVTALEGFLFDASYKGVTDLVTKWLWPAPARLVVGVCARNGITPNMVTSTGLVLVLLATWLFAEGHFAAGLLPAWIMTFLDTVDGKLARVTVTSSKFGHYLDHVTDLVHPPLWYAAWGAGLVGGWDRLEQLTAPLAWIVAGYAAGRIAEGAFKHFVAGFSMFSWRPFDSWFRLITGRRNPNLLLLTAAVVAGAPHAGLTAVAVWTVASTLVLLARLLQGAGARMRGEKLAPWLAAIDPDSRAVPFYAQPFAPDGAALARLAPRG